MTCTSPVGADRSPLPPASSGHSAPIVAFDGWRHPRRSLFCATLLWIATAHAAHGQAIFVEADGSTNGSHFGAAVIRVGDFDGDQQDDLLVGSPTAGGLAGEVSVVSSATGAVLLTQAGAQPLAMFGSALLRLTDLNADQVPEIAIGAPEAGGANPAGAIRIHDGATLTQISSIPGPSPQARLGHALVQLDDQTGDGVPEFAAGAPGADNGAVNETGAVFVFNGVTGALVRTFTGQMSFDAYGTSISPIGDLSGDGLMELVIGASGADVPGASGAGLIQVVNPVNGLVVRTILGAAINGALGTSCAGLLDVDGDAVPDIAGGAPGEQSFAGSVQVFSGANGAVLNTLFGQSPADRLGLTLASLGDIDRDGRGDYAAGSDVFTVGGAANSGQVIVYSGATHGLLYLFEGESALDSLGGEVRLLGDLDGDGRDEFAVGSPRSDLAGTDAGRIEVRSGLTGALTINSTGMFGSPYSVTLQATPGSEAFLLVDNGPGSVPSAFGEICLALSPVLFVTKIPPLNPIGFSTFSGTLPGPIVPPGTTFFIQAFVEDPNSFSGWRTSECASLTLIP